MESYLQEEVCGNHMAKSTWLICIQGTDGVHVWDIKTLEEIHVPKQPLQEHGQVSYMCWITRKSEAFDTLCYGNALGYLIFLQHHPTEVSKQKFLILQRLSPIKSDASNKFTQSALLGRARSSAWQLMPQSEMGYRNTWQVCSSVGLRFEQQTIGLHSLASI